MQTKLVVALCFFLFMQMALAQTDRLSIIKDQNLTKFDIEYFFYNNEEGKTKREKHNGYEIEYNSSSKDYYTQIYLDNGYKYFLTYDKNGNIFSKTQSYQGMLCGYIYKYNSEGKIIKKINCDEQYGFSIDDVLQKIKTEFKPGTLKKINRFFLKEGVNRPFYIISYNPKQTETKEDFIARGGSLKEYCVMQDLVEFSLLDGNTGDILVNYKTVPQIIENTIGREVEKEKTPIDQYLDDLKEKANTHKKTNWFGF